MKANFTIPAAMILDFILGDPQRIPHPVRGMGWCILQWEKFIRARLYPLKTAGITLAFGLPFAVWVLAALGMYCASKCHETVRLALEVWLIYQCISIRGLIDETWKIHEALFVKDIDDARMCLSRVVGRDTQNLEETDIARATVETIAEGSVDGVFSPLFFAALGGAQLALAFKAVSTLDSMIGYKNDRYMEFGWASAKLDDLANWIPARLSLLVIPAAAFLTGLNGWRSLSTGFRDRRKHPSPNAGHAESAYAGALGIQLGGVNYYQGVKSDKPALNTEGDRPNKNHIIQSFGLLVVSSILFLCIVFIGQMAVCCTS